MLTERLIWIVPLVVAALGAWRPRAGLVVLAASLPLFGAPPGGPYLGALDVAGIAAILTAWRGGRPSPTAMTWPVAAFVAVSLLSMLPPAYLPPSWRPSVLLGLLEIFPGVQSWSALYTWRAAADLLLGCGLFLAVRRAFSGRSLLPLAWGLLAGLTVTMGLGLAAQWGLVDLDGWRPDRDAHLPTSRMESLFFLSGWLSQYIVFVAPVAIAPICLNPRTRLLFGPLLLLVLVCLALSQQRGAWIAVAAQLAFWTAVEVKTGRLTFRRVAVMALALLIALVGVLLLSPDSLRAPLERIRAADSVFGNRSTVWSGAAELAGQRPFLGWGLGAFGPAFDLLRPPGDKGWTWYRLTAHNLYLHVTVERGLPGLAALALLGTVAAWCLRRPIPGQELLALALAISLVGTAVYGLVQYVYYLRNVAWLLWLLTAAATLVSRRQGWLVATRAGQVIVLLALLLLPVRILVLDAPAYADDRSFGFHETENHPEGAFRWTEGAAGYRVPWRGETMILSLANGHPLEGKRPVTVGISIDGRPRATLTIRGGWEEHRIALGPPRGEWVVLSLDVRPVFRPFNDFRQYPQLQPSKDIRSLGVAVREVRWE